MLLKFGTEHFAHFNNHLINAGVENEEKSKQPTAGICSQIE